jgi:hypothetical protein
VGKAKPTKKPPALTFTAYHEAGHVVVAVLLRLPLRHATIGRDDEAGTLGLVSHRLKHAPDKVDGIRARLHFENHTMCSWGGIVAEWFLTGRRNWRGARQDLHAIDESALMFCDERREAEAYVAWLRIRTEKLLATIPNWRAIESVASALTVHTRLPASRLRAIVSQAVRSAETPSGADLQSLERRLAMMEG